MKSFCRLGLGCVFAMVSLPGAVHADGNQKTSVKNKARPLVFDMEILSGYRQDNLHFSLYSNTGRPSQDYQDSTAQFFQSNLVLGLSVFDRGYFNVMGGYGLLLENRAHFTTEWLSVPFTTRNTITGHAGYAADWDIVGGYFFTVYKKAIRIAPELGYGYKRVKVTHAFTEQFKAPYAGARIDFQLSKKHKVHLDGFFDWYYCISRYDLNYAYAYFGDYAFTNDTVTSGTSYAYKTGAILTYQPYKHWTFGLKYQYFHDRTKPVTVSISSGIYSGTQKMRWTSQEAQFSADYRF